MELLSSIDLLKFALVNNLTQDYGTKGDQVSPICFKRFQRHVIGRTKFRKFTLNAFYNRFVMNDPILISLKSYSHIKKMRIILPSLPMDMMRVGCGPKLMMILSLTCSCWPLLPCRVGRGVYGHGQKGHHMDDHGFRSVVHRFHFYGTFLVDTNTLRSWGAGPSCSHPEELPVREVPIALLPRCCDITPGQSLLGVHLFPAAIPSIHRGMFNWITNERQFLYSLRLLFFQVMAYFTLCLWLVPFALFVSLSANDNVLPTSNERTHLLSDNDVVTNYFSSRKKIGLLSLFNYAKESLLPERNKKAF